MWTPAFERFVAPARLRPELWRTGLGTLLIVAVYVAVVSGALALVALWWSWGRPPAEQADAAARFALFAAGRTPWGVLLLLATFAGMAAGAALAVRWLHGRTARSLAGPHLLRDFVPAAAITLLIGGAAALVGLGGMELVPNVAPTTFALLLPLALAALAVQTGAEELVFRGYLQTQLAARFRSPVAWMLLPSLLFGALHLDAGFLLAEGRLAENDGLILAATTLVGLLAADLTRVTGSLGAAWGLHFANNVQALLVVAIDDILSGMALWRTPFSGDDLEALPALILADMGLLVVIWAVIRLWLARAARHRVAA
ncbi:CPBP family intramembrane glutamic endopeptidase [Jannaschia sp. W003]|uniref:CPBP family intramembrane glutamic endopeptidase n=1 Tax=Jannaschia sp. W003 TaxID=2867012 RepID=UPI0021A32C91|nr:CPBP family intramembrane glutamic endopeptidase [Jannaschia sp. W003]UWQ21890.1 CPBP family intramembrane metalloprotease [Jannaschia sp. W003]